MLKRLIWLLAVGLSYGAESKDLRTTVLHRETLEPFLDKYCVSCHGEEKQKGQVRLDDVSWLVSDNDSAQRWQDVLDQLNSGDMPPWDEEQPKEEELTEVLGKLTGHMQEARQRLTARNDGAQMRRLNKREYANTIRELFGFDLRLVDLPEDGDFEGFDTEGSEQLFSAVHIQQYLRLGRRLAKDALRWNTSKYREVNVKREDCEKELNPRLLKGVQNADEKKRIRDAGGTWQEMGFDDKGDAEILFRQWDGRVERPRSYLNYPRVDEGVYLCHESRGARINLHVDHRASYKVRIKGGVNDQGGVDELRRIIKVSDNHNVLGTRKMYGSINSPQIVEMDVEPTLGGVLTIAVHENYPNDRMNFDQYVRRLEGPINPKDPGARVWVDWIEIEGPFYPEKRPVFEELLYPGVETGGKSSILNDDRKAKQLIEDFAYHAFRREKPHWAYVDSLYKYFIQQREDGVKYKEALAEVMAVILSSPNFLYIQKTEPVEKGLYLSSRELAVRLSYFLWSSPPDEELYEANLYNKAQYMQQVDRMLAHPKAKAFRDGFVSQWSEFERYDAVSVDESYVKFNPGLQLDAKKEVMAFFEELVEKNLPVTNLISSDFVMVNDVLAHHYDLKMPEKVVDGRFVKVDVPAQSPRGGLFTQAAFLVTGSNGERTSPVIRGALLMEKFMHDKPAPPPPNVPELGVSTGEPLSNKQLIELHQNQPACASCHREMDQLGLALENFDSVGSWRDEERLDRRKSVRIPTGGELPNGTKFASVNEFKQIMLETMSPKVAEEIVESLLAYGLGRRVEFSDQPGVELILEQTQPGGYRMRDIIKAVVLSQIFRQK